MKTTRSHAPIHRVLAAAGVDMYARWEPPTTLAAQRFLTMSEEEEAAWMAERAKSLAMLRDMKSFRRGGAHGFCGFNGEGICEVGDEEVVKMEEEAASMTSGTQFVLDDGDVLDIRKEEEDAALTPSTSGFTLHNDVDAISMASSACLTLDDLSLDEEIAEPEVAVLVRWSKARLEVLGQKEDGESIDMSYDEPASPAYSAASFVRGHADVPNDITPSLDSRSLASTSDSYWDYYLDKNSGTDEA